MYAGKRFNGNPWFPNPADLEIRMQQLLLDMFIWFGLLVVNMVPAGAGIKKLLYWGDSHQIVCTLGYIQ